MFRVVKYFLCSIVFSHYALCVPPSNSLTKGMLSEIIQCLEGEKTPEKLISEWKWGQFKRAFMFEVSDANGNTTELNYIFAACPKDVSGNDYLCFEFLPQVTICDLDPQDTPYFFIGLQRSYTNKQFSLIFVTCKINSDLYSNFLDFFDLQKPSYPDIKAKQPSQFWDTSLCNNTHLEGFNQIDDQFITWGELKPGLDIVFRFNKEKNTGVMLRRHQPSCPKKSVPPKATLSHLDLRKLTKEFIWIPEHMERKFENETKAKDKKTTSEYRENSVYWEQKRLDVFNLFKVKYGSNSTYIKKVGLELLGGVKTPPCDRFGAPWPEFGYFFSKKYGILLRSNTLSGGYVTREQVESFILNTSNIYKDSSLFLPYEIDVRPYLQAYPTSNLLYEHIRADGRARIIVQPYIASLYVDGKLSKILVCNDKNGPADHGWSLVRKYYCYEEMPEYFWPVSRAYCPLELD